ncbi:MAG: signal recognition particle subunit SRP19/SEC65 family protein, partial [Candidatus Bathyarchaeia archaeon]
MREKGKVVIWPSYLEASLPRGDGRRVPRAIAKRGVTAEDVYRAAQELGLNPELNRSAAHPRIPWRKTGLVMVDKKMPKTSLLKELALRIRCK